MTARFVEVDTTEHLSDDGDVALREPVDGLMRGSRVKAIMLSPEVGVDLIADGEVEDASDDVFGELCKKGDVKLAAGTRVVRVPEFGASIAGVTHHLCGISAASEATPGIWLKNLEVTMWEVVAHRMVQGNPGREGVVAEHFGILEAEGWAFAQHFKRFALAE